MKREDLLAKGYTEEQVTDILNTFHGINKENEKLKGELIEKADIEAKFNEANAKLEEINKASMTEQEKFEAMKKEAEATKNVLRKRRRLLTQALRRLHRIRTRMLFLFPAIWFTEESTKVMWVFGKDYIN